jgi:hypothetical protein
MKLKFTITACALALAAQAATAHTEVGSYPLKPVLDALPSGNEVALYFGSQPHPQATSQLGEESKSARIARAMDDEPTACNHALTQALTDLRNYARDHHANGVVNIRTSFHSTETASASEFTCATSGSAAALKVTGDLVTFTAQ